MSKTLKELFDENGSVWLSYKGEKLFKPLGYNDGGCVVIGEGLDGRSNWYPVDTREFTLYQAPIKTKTVTMWSPVFKNDGGSRNGLDLHATKEDVFKTGYIGRVIGAAPIQVEVLDGN